MTIERQLTALVCVYNIEVFTLIVCYCYWILGDVIIQLYSGEVYQ